MAAPASGQLCRVRNSTPQMARQRQRGAQGAEIEKRILVVSFACANRGRRREHVGDDEFRAQRIELRFGDEERRRGIGKRRCALRRLIEDGNFPSGPSGALAI